jgi:short-subunit dehydrogenase
LDISVLVNNVGVDVLDHFHNLSEQTIIDLIKINCLAVSVLNRIFIPVFQKRFSKKSLKSAIINVASVAGIKINKCRINSTSFA